MNFKSLLLALCCAFVVQDTAASADYRLDLGGQSFDPVSITANPQDPWQRTAAGAGLMLVQFKGPTQPSWLAALRGVGLTPLQYIYPYSYVVWGDTAAAGRAAAAPEVRWSGSFLPAFKVQPSQRALGSALQSTMMLVSRHADRAALAVVLANSGAQIELQATLDTHFDILQIRVAGDAYLELAQLPGVYAVQAIAQGGGPRGESSNQSIVGNYGPAPTHTIVPGYADWLSATGYDGSGVTVSIVDGGVRTTHLDLASRMLPCVSAGGGTTSCSSSNDSHGTHVAGAVAGTAATGALHNAFLRGQGVAPGANLVQQRYGAFLGAGPGSMIANGMLTIYKEAALSDAVLANNSWGPTGTPQGYDIPTQQIDMIVRDADPDAEGAQAVLPVWSIMNGNGDANGACAPSSLGSPDEAKNLFAVGSTKLLSGGNQLSAIFDVSSNSAHGNACDGRRVPHIVAPGCSTDSTASSSNSAHSFTFCGTSMASPVVTGAASLFVDKYRDLNAGSTPSPALIKAAFTAAAQNLQGFRNADNGLLGHRPDRFQGYGRIDLEAVMNPPQAVFYFDQSELFSASGQVWSVSLGADDPDQPVKVMLAWTDARGHGLGGSTPAWVNDLDLLVQVDGNDFLGNVIGSDGWSVSDGEADIKNNLEGVFLRADQHSGALSVTVNASNIAADALHPFEPGEPAQDFALVCYNCVQVQAGDADIGLSLSADVDPVGAGQTLLISAEIANLGPDEVTGTRLTLTLPAALSYISAARVAGAGTWTCSERRQQVDCVQTAGSLPVDNLAATLSIETTVLANAISGASNVVAEVQAPTFGDPELANNSKTLAVNVIGTTIFADGFE